MAGDKCTMLLRQAEKAIWVFTSVPAVRRTGRSTHAFARTYVCTFIWSLLSALQLLYAPIFAKKLTLVLSPWHTSPILFPAPCKRVSQPSQIAGKKKESERMQSMKSFLLNLMIQIALELAIHVHTSGWSKIGLMLGSPTPSGYGVLVHTPVDMYCICRI